VGITSGIVSPWLIGLVKTRTGNMDIALYILAGLLLLSGLTMWSLIPRKPAAAACLRCRPISPDGNHRKMWQNRRRG
jgi:MFS-type transporter involved in bile tolerance (Atg22 family)